MNSHLAAPEPKSGASTNSATSATYLVVIKVIGKPQQRFVMAGLPGFEPGNGGIKAAALPLGDSPQVLAFQLSAFQNKESMVRKERLELSHLAAPEPKSGASTNSAISAYLIL